MSTARAPAPDHVSGRIGRRFTEFLGFPWSHGGAESARPSVHLETGFSQVARWGHGGTTVNRFARKVRFPRSDGAAMVAGPHKPGSPEK